METIELPLVFASQPKPQHLDFPLKSDVELEKIRQAAAKKFAHLPRPSRIFDNPWGFQRSRHS